MKGPPLPPLPHRTLTEALARAGESAAGLVFVDTREEDTRLSWADVYARSLRVAGGLAARGVRAGDRVALVLPTSPAFVTSFFGTLLAGAVPVPLYPPVRLARLDEYHQRTAALLGAAGARLVVTDGRLRALLGVAVEAARPALGCVRASDLEGAPLAREAGPEALALVQFSSGTTVEPKPVALSHRNLLANVAAIGTLFDPAQGPPVGVSWLPLYHDMGLVGCLLVACAHPVSLALLPPELFLARPAAWLRAIARHRAVISPAPNFAYGLCVKRVRDEELAGVDLSCWAFALNGAEPVSPAVLRRFADRFAPWGFRPEALTPVYGLAEASLAVTFSDAKSLFRTRGVDAGALAREGRVQDGAREVASVGRPVAGVEVRIRDAQGRALPDGEVGRIEVRGDAVMQGYLGLPEATAAVLKDGWLDTGDLGFVSDGELYVCGRAKELVVLRGANHAPREFEEALDGVDGVRPGCVVAFGFTPDGGEGEELGLLVETEGDTGGLEERVRGRVAEATGIRPHTVALLAPGTLPRTSSGKLRRAEAARLFLSGELAAPGPVRPWGVAAAMVRGELGLLRARLGG